METRKKIKSSPADKVFTVCNTIFMILFIIITLYPILNTLALAFNEGTDALRGGIYLIPRKWTLKNFITVLQKDNLITGAYITVARTLIGTFTALITNAILAFIVSRKRFLFKKQLSLFWVITMYVNAGFIPYYLLISNIGLKNDFLVYILPSAVQAYFIILVKTYIESIPGELIESAEIDGAGLVKIYFKLIIPLAKPILACIIVFAAVNQWNAWADDMYFMQGRKSATLHCLQYLLYTKLQSNVVSSTAGAAAGAAIKVSSTTLRMAMSFITVVPILCVYPFMQRFFTKGIMLGAVKG